MERSPFEHSFGGANCRERSSPKDSRHVCLNLSVEPEPSSVVARLKEALDNPLKEQSLEELRSSMGVSLFADQRMLDYSLAMEYDGSTFRDGVLRDWPSRNSEIEESGSLDSVSLAVPLSPLGNIVPVVSKQMREVMELPAREPQTKIKVHQRNSSKRFHEAGAFMSTLPIQIDINALDDFVVQDTTQVLMCPASVQEISNGSTVGLNAGKSTVEESAPDAREKLFSNELSNVKLCSIDVSSPSVVVVRESVVEEGLSDVNARADPEKTDNFSVVFSPDSLFNDPDAYLQKSFDSVGERSELVNIATHGSDWRPVPPDLPWAKRGCAGCGRANLLLEKEYCMACGAKYCGNCLLPAMGSMPEGRKCVTCLGLTILGSRRPYIGKPSRLLKHLFSPLEVQQIMKAEKEGPANQLRSEQVVVNNRPLSYEELTSLLGCTRPPLKLKPGRYWYDGQTGLWGKDGHRPDRIVTPSLKLGGNLQPNSSNGKTQVFMNGRELGKLELKMLKFAGVKCSPETHLWVENDGSYSEEGFKNVKGNIWGKEGNLWGKASINLLYPFFSFPTPRSNVGVGGGSARHSNRFPGLLDPLRIHKLLLLGHEGSGRSTIFKQAKILYNAGFTKEELVSFKSLIQANTYKYLVLLLEGRERFEEEDDNRGYAPANQEPSSSNDLENSQSSSSPQADFGGSLKWNDGKRKQKETVTNVNIYRLEPSMKELSDWFMESIIRGNFDTAVPQSSSDLEDVASKIEQLWLDSAVQATFQRKAELVFLPDVASVFLDRVLEVSRHDFEPVEADILQTEGLSQGSGLVQIEISLDDNDFGAWQDADTTCGGLDRYQVIRVGGKGMSDRHKWLDMFEDVRAVVFCVSLSDYNSLWNDRSGNPCNKMIQTRDLFDSILRHPCFQDTPFVLLLNKYDIFEDKIEKGVPLTTCSWFSDFRPVGTSHYTAQNQAQQAYQYIAHKYKELFNSVNCTGRKLFTFQLNALDKATVSGAFQYVKEILKWEEHKAAGWGMIPEESSYSTDISSFSQRSKLRQLI